MNDEPKITAQSTAALVNAPPSQAVLDAPPVRERLAAQRLLDDSGAGTRVYRLVVKKGAPLSSCSIDSGLRLGSGGVAATFSRNTTHVVDGDAGPERETRVGSLQELTDAQVKHVRLRASQMIVRWTAPAQMRAIILDSTLPTVIVNPETDQPLEDFIEILDANVPAA